MPLQTDLPLALQTIVPGLDVTWRLRQAGYRADRNAVLSIVSRPSRGVDEPRYTAEGDQIRERIYGVRRLAVQVKIETQDQDIADSAHELAETIRTGLHRTDVEAILDASDLGGVQTTEPRAMDYRAEGGRWRSAVVFEIWLNTHTSHLGALIDTVGSVEVSGEIEPGPVVFGPVIVDEDD